MPDKVVRFTKVIKGSVNPTFDEKFDYELERNSLENSYLMIDILDYDKLSKNESFGYVKIPLNNLFCNNSNEISKIVIKIIRPHEKISEVILKACYNSRFSTILTNYTYL